MSLYIPTTNSEIEDFELCIAQFKRMRGRYYKRRKVAVDTINKNQITCSIQYFNSRLEHYRKRIAKLEEWRD